VAIVALFAFSGLVPGIINSTDPIKIQEYPNYLWVYIHHNVTSGTGILFIMLIYYCRRPKLRDFFKRHFPSTSEFNFYWIFLSSSIPSQFNL